MFDWLKTKVSKGKTISFKIDGMHCTSCSMNIDGELEDLDGVISAQTSYAHQRSKIQFDPDRVSTQQLKERITELGYIAKEES